MTVDIISSKMNYMNEEENVVCCRFFIYKTEILQKRVRINIKMQQCPERQQPHRTLFKRLDRNIAVLSSLNNSR